MRLGSKENRKVRERLERTVQERMQKKKRERLWDEDCEEKTYRKNENKNDEIK